MSDLHELMARDPLTLSREDISVIVEEMRKSRHAFNAGNLRAGSTKPKTEKQKQVAKLAETLKLDIDL